MSVSVSVSVKVDVGVVTTTEVVYGMISILVGIEDDHIHNVRLLWL